MGLAAIVVLQGGWSASGPLRVLEVLGVIVVGELDVAAFHRVLLVTAALLIAGGIVAFVGIRNPKPVAVLSDQLPPGDRE